MWYFTLQTVKIIAQYHKYNCVRKYLHSVLIIKLELAYASHHFALKVTTMISDILFF